jgi:hypothetical protein
MDFTSEDEAVGAGEASATAAGVAIATGGTARVPRVIERRISITFSFVDAGGSGHQHG